jgi:3-keto-5-aminohexanoate cleavage enzyme
MHFLFAPVATMRLHHNNRGSFIRRLSMVTPVIITVAITGALPRKKDNPAVPITPSEQIESTHEAYEAGASIVHLHVRSPDESPCSDPELFARVQEGIRKHCPGMIVQFSTGGRGREQAARGAMLHLKPDMASLATGSVNFPTGIYENPPDFVEALAKTMLENEIKPEIEVFDLAMLYSAANLVKKGLLAARPHLQFVMGVPNAMPARRSIFDFLRAELKDVLPDATWVAAGIGRHQWEVNQWCLQEGGHCRTGLEDNARYDQTRLAASNAELVQKIVDRCDQYDRRPASSAEARKILGLREVPEAASVLKSKTNVGI